VPAPFDLMLEADAARWPERLEHIGDQAAAAFSPERAEGTAHRIATFRTAIGQPETWRQKFLAFARKKDYSLSSLLYCPAHS